MRLAWPYFFSINSTIASTVGRVAGKELVADRQTLRRDHQADIDLLAVRAMIAGVTARGLFVAEGLALKIGAGHVVEQELKLHAKPILVAFQQMGAELIFVRVQHVQSAVEPRVIDLAKGHAQQIFQRTIAIPALRHFELAALATETGHGQDAGRQFPGHVLVSGRKELLQERVQSQPPPERERQVNLAELPHALDADPAQIDLRPLRRWRRR
jgi:hypothetical protein